MPPEPKLRDRYIATDRQISSQRDRDVETETEAQKRVVERKTQIQRQRMRRGDRVRVFETESRDTDRNGEEAYLWRGAMFVVLAPRYVVLLPRGQFRCFTSLRQDMSSSQRHMLSFILAVRYIFVFPFVDILNHSIEICLLSLRRVRFYFGKRKGNGETAAIYRKKKLMGIV